MLSFELCLCPSAFLHHAKSVFPFLSLFLSRTRTRPNPYLQSFQLPPTDTCPLLVRAFDEWVNGRARVIPLSQIQGAIIGVDASYYISQHLNNLSTREALLGALGGFPLALHKTVEKELQTWKSLGVRCIFVFNGLDFGKKEYRVQSQPAPARSFEQAWELYDQQQADQVVDAFSNAGMLFYRSPPISPRQPTSLTELFANRSKLLSIQSPPRIPPTHTDPYHPSGTPPPENLYSFLQRILTQMGVSFMVAPYSSVAQVSYGIAGPRSGRH